MSKPQIFQEINTKSTVKNNIVDVANGGREFEDTNGKEEGKKDGKRVVKRVVKKDKDGYILTHNVAGSTVTNNIFGEDFR